MLRLYWIRGASNRAYEILSNVGAPHLLVDMIPANNARYPDKEPAVAILFMELQENGGRECLQVS